MKNRLHIALIHDQCIPPVAYGGTERVLVWLVKGLYELGHKVTVITKDGSQSPHATIVSRPEGDARVAGLIPKDADLVHSFATLREDIQKPYMVTIHGNGQPGESFHQNTVFVSHNHAARHGSSAFAYNGLDPSEYPKAGMKEPYCYFLAKARWGVKNVKGAISVAKKAGLPIKIMGGWRPSFSRKVRWLGMLGGEEKNLVLSAGSALVFPVRWPEPFGLAIIEAMLTGSPVFGTTYGALPELVSLETGFLANSADTLARELKKANFNPETLRNHVLKNFTYKSMTQKYLEFYEQILAKKPLNPEEPRTLETRAPETLLPFQY